MLTFSPRVKLGKSPVLLACHFTPLQAGFLPLVVVPQQRKPDCSGCVSAKLCPWVGAELRPSEIVVGSWETQGTINGIHMLIFI